MTLFGPKRTNFAALVTRPLFIAMFVLTIVVLFQNFEINRQITSQEIARANKQTAALIQSTFNYRISSLEIQQDAYSRSEPLITAIHTRRATDFDQFFLGVDQIDPDIVPDFRFVVTEEQIIWDDGNIQLFGINSSHLNNIMANMTFSSNWHLLEVPSLLGTRHTLVRRAPVVNITTGEVSGSLYVGMVLDDNYALITSFEKAANVESLFVTYKDNLIATNTKDATEQYSKWITRAGNTRLHQEYMVSRLALRINGDPTPLYIYAVQDTQRISQLTTSHYIWVGTAIMLILMVVVASKVWLQRIINKDLSRLMSYTKNSVEHKHLESFPGSQVAEFDLIGHGIELAMKQLITQERQFEDLFNHSLTPILLWDTRGNCLKMNPAAERCFSNPDTGNEEFSLLSLKLYPQIRMAAFGATLTGINTEVSDKVYRWNLSPFVVDGETTLIITQGQDVTSLIEAERQSLEARKQAEESAQVRADFLARMSHELRTPLNGILGISQLLKTSIKDHKQLEHIDVLCNSGEHLLAVLNDILDFSKIEQGKFHIQRADFRLNEVLSVIENIYRPMCEKKGIQLHIESNVDETTTIQSDQVRLNQILFNLVSNAVKFTHKGNVTVSLNVDDRNDEQWIQCDITDSGIGIEPEKLGSVFEPFVQAEPTISREYGGSGLGLAIVKSLIDLMDGQISVQSKLGEGTRFAFALPIKLSAELPDREHYDLQSKSLFDHTVRVLLVEDNHTNAFIAAAFCKKYGMEVVRVEEGQQAIDFIKNNPDIDLILMDNQLPNMDGIEVTRIIRNELHSTIPVYACTADGMQQTKTAFMEAGADYVLVKPLKERALNIAFQHFKHNHYRLDESNI
ncbi:quorum-sensing autoinducer 2 sensor kinase/phosphatase LuxQ [Vibrio sp.]|uniref:quorum-sensing autoinducer 2 sensor kinase/phosphatase LuxQ n=1 Tax=Vibrio sp. TaxID=678 RepID=UPI003D0D2CC6